MGALIRAEKKYGERKPAGDAPVCEICGEKLEIDPESGETLCLLCEAVEEQDQER